MVRRDRARVVSRGSRAGGMRTRRPLSRGEKPKSGENITTMNCVESARGPRNRICRGGGKAEKKKKTPPEPGGVVCTESAVVVVVVVLPAAHPPADAAVGGRRPGGAATATANRNRLTMIVIGSTAAATVDAAFSRVRPSAPAPFPPSVLVARYRWKKSERIFSTLYSTNCSHRLYYNYYYHC